MQAASSQYCVLWNNYHGSLVQTIGGLRQDGQLVDVTIVCSDGSRVPAHQLVLAACSTFFRNFIRDNPSKHPIVLLPSDIHYSELNAMIEFMYTGQVCVQQERLQSFIKGARYLRIRGLEDPVDDSEAEDLGMSDAEKGPNNHQTSRQMKRSRTSDQETSADGLRTTTVRGKKVKDHRYTQMVDLGDSDENRENWEVVDRKPVIFPRTHQSSSGMRRRRKKSCMRKRAMHISNNIVCYEQREKRDNDKYCNEDEPINKVRRMNSEGHQHDEMDDICTCTSRKIWSVKDTEALLKAWRETLSLVPPSYFIRSMSLCKSVAKRLQQRGVKKNWRQCQVKMKNLRREVRTYKETAGERPNLRKPSEVASACEKLLPYIEDIFNKEEAIRTQWYRMKSERVRDDELTPQDLLPQVEVLDDSDICDEDTDVPAIETEGEGCGLTEGEGGTYTEGDDGVDIPFVTTVSAPHHRMHTDAEGTVHHIVEDISLRVHVKDEPPSASEL